MVSNVYIGARYVGKGRERDLGAGMQDVSAGYMWLMG